MYAQYTLQFAISWLIINSLNFCWLSNVKLYLLLGNFVFIYWRLEKNYVLMLSFLLFYLDTFILSKNKTVEAPQTIKQKQNLTRNFGKNY